MTTKTTCEADHAAERRVLTGLARVLNERYGGPVAGDVTDASWDAPVLPVSAPMPNPGVIVGISIDPDIDGWRFWVEAYGAEQWVDRGKPFATSRAQDATEALAAVASYVPPPDVFQTPSGSSSGARRQPARTPAFTADLRCPGLPVNRRDGRTRNEWG